MKRHQTRILAAILLAITLGSCRGDEPKRIPDTLPDVHGSIESIAMAAQDNDEAQATVRVRAVEGIEAKYPEASITITKSTLIESTTGEHLKLEQLRDGQEIEAWFEGGVMESYPVQGQVKAVRVHLQ